VALFSIFGWVSIISIVALIIGNSILLLIRETDKIEGSKKLIPFFVIPFSYLMMRLIFFYFPIAFINTVSLISMILATALVTYLLIRPKTNKFKTKEDIKKPEKKEKKKRKKRRRKKEKKGEEELDEG
jgi:Ca2+/Na+ antiporter